jgi:hypothetical protein
MSDKTTVNNNSIGFIGLLTIVFVIAKITGYVAWSWLWVFSPIIFSIVGIIILIFLAAIFS